MHGWVWRAEAAATVISLCALLTAALASERVDQLAQNAPDAERAATAPSQPAGASTPAASISVSGRSGFGSMGSSTAPASIKVLNGAAAGREVNLTKVVTTVGKPGVQVASITRRPTGYVFAHVEGAARPTVNGNPLVGETVPLRNGDVIKLAGTQMQFVQT
jgi:hypothetical protein